MSRIKTAIGKKIRWIRKKVLSYKLLRVWWWPCSLYGIRKPSPTVSEQRHEAEALQQSVDIPGRGHSKCKRPELRACLVQSRKSQETCAAEANEWGEEQVRYTNTWKYWGLHRVGLYVTPHVWVVVIAGIYGVCFTCLVLSAADPKPATDRLP